MMSMNFAENIAQAMTLIHQGWQVPGCRRLLLDYAHEAPSAPLAEVGAAALLFAQAPNVQAPSLELFRNGPWWTAQMPTHARTLRPSDAPRCTVHEHETLPCRSCAAEEKAELYRPQPIRDADVLAARQAQVDAAGIALVREKLREAAQARSS